MYDYTKIMAGAGIESMTDNGSVSLEEEMLQEIALESDIDNAFMESEMASLIAYAGQGEAMLANFANREVSLESNNGIAPEVVWAGFHGLESFNNSEISLEAVRDVIARKAYAGMANIKSLINTCISWLKNLLGFNVASKKVFTGLSKKAENSKKALAKKQSKVSDKLKRTMPDYAKALNDVAGEYEKFNTKAASTIGGLESFEDADVETARTAIKDLEKWQENLKEVYSKEGTEMEGNAAYSHINAALDGIKAKSDAFKGDDIVKNIQKAIKALEKLRGEVGKQAAPKPGLTQVLTTEISYYTKLNTVSKATLKKIVQIADDILTDAKGILAAL